jgi:hypothetical protein
MDFSSIAATMMDWLHVCQFQLANDVVVPAAISTNANQPVPLVFDSVTAPWAIKALLSQVIDLRKIIMTFYTSTSCREEAQPCPAVLL